MLNDITIGQYFPGKSVIHRFDPRTKIVALLIFVVLVFSLHHWQSYVAGAAFLLVSFGSARLPVRLLWRAVKPLWLLLFFTLVMNAFMLPGEIIWQWKIFSISREGVLQGAELAIRLVFLIVASSLLTFTTSPIALTDALERLLSPGKRFGLPAHELAMMMSIALRFIPTLIEETDRIMKAQISRGADFSSGNIIKRAKNMIPLLVPLFISAFRRADELAIAMEARCYRGGEGRTRMRCLSMQTSDWLLIVFLLLMLFVALFGKYRHIWS